MIFAGTTQGGHVDFTNILDEGAASLEWAAGRRIERRWQISFEQGALFFSGTNFGDGGEEGLGVRMGGSRGDDFGGADFHRVPQIHDHDAMADMLDHGEIVRDEEVSEAAFALDVLQEVDDLGLHGDIESADGFVADEKAGFDGEGARDADALTLAAAEFVGIAEGVLGLEADRLQ